MSFAAVGIGLGVSAAGSVFKFIKGQQQRKQAAAMRPYDPGFTPNQQLVDNARQLQERYTNYQLPGYAAAQAGINQAASQAFGQGIQGATSSGDVLDLATRTQYNRQQGLNNLALANAQGQDAALGQYLNANAAVGQDRVRLNMLELDRYNQQLREKAALEQASAENTFGAINDLASGIGSTVTSTFMPQPILNTDGSIGQGQSAFQMWLNKRRNNG